MKTIVAVPADPPRSTAFRNTAWVLAVLLTCMAVGQLFSFEKFIPLMTEYMLPGGHGTAVLVACLAVFFEVFGLPFLIRMPISPLMRWFSMVCSLLAAGLWIGLTLSYVIHPTVMSGSGMLGVKVNLPAGGLSLVVAIILGILAIVSSAGLWPGSKKLATKHTT